MIPTEERTFLAKLGDLWRHYFTDEEVVYTGDEPRRACIIPQSLEVDCGNIEIKTMASGGQVMARSGFGTQIFVDGNELRGVKSLTFTLNPDDAILVSVELIAMEPKPNSGAGAYLKA